MKPTHSSTIHATLARIAQFVIVRGSQIGPLAKPKQKRETPSHPTRHKPGPQNGQRVQNTKTQTPGEQRTTSPLLADMLEEHRVLILSRAHQETFHASRADCQAHILKRKSAILHIGDNIVELLRLPESTCKPRADPGGRGGPVPSSSYHKRTMRNKRRKKGHPGKGVGGSDSSIQPQICSAGLPCGCTYSPADSPSAVVVLDPGNWETSHGAAIRRELR